MILPWYERLIYLAEEPDTASTQEKIKELNDLLSTQNVDSIKDKDLQVLDDLITILANTGNLYAEKHEAIINLQDDIRIRFHQ